MKKCTQTIKATCGDSIYDECVDYQGTANTQSELFENQCITIGESTQDIYNQLEEINVTDIEDCLEYDQGESGKIEIKDVVKKYGAEICNIKDTIEQLSQFNICNAPISGCNFELGGLVDSCGEQPNTVGELLQIIINTLNTP